MPHDARTTINGAAFAWFLIVRLGLYVAGQKGRSGVEAVVFCGLLGPLGLILVAMMPTVQPDDEDERERASAASASDGRITRIRPSEPPQF